MKKHKFHIEQIIRKYYPAEAENLLAKMAIIAQNLAKDVAFSKTSGNPIDKRMEIAADFLALMRVLDENGENFEQIKKISLEIATIAVQPENAFQAWLKKLPPKLISLPFMNLLLALFHKKVSKNAHSEGFIANIITDKKETYGLGYGVDILECGICKLFKKYDYGKFAPIFCEVDYVTSALAGLTIIRSGTIANGAKKCDFRFVKIDSKTKGIPLT
jgi:hypothetical protein